MPTVTVYVVAAALLVAVAELTELEAADCAATRLPPPRTSSTKQSQPDDRGGIDDRDRDFIFENTAILWDEDKSTISLFSVMRRMRVMKKGG